MAKQVKIKDIAKMAGVSAGTVDRILHNRGKVSKASREAVEKSAVRGGLQIQYTHFRHFPQERIQDCNQHTDAGDR